MHSDADATRFTKTVYSEMSISVLLQYNNSEIKRTRSSVKTAINTDWKQAAKLQSLLMKSALALHLHSYKNETKDATMTILDIGLPTGFDVEENDLKQVL